MNTQERLYLMAGVWLAVFPSVTALSYALEPTDWPLWLKTLASTALTVPLITFAVVPTVKKIIAKAEDKPEIAED